MQGEDPIQFIGRRYLLLEELGGGGMGTVYRARDRLTGQIVALKRVLAAVQSEALRTQPHRAATDPDASRLALTREFQTLASLRHPNIISVLDYGFDQDDRPYFTMALLENPRTILQAGEGQPLLTRINLLIQMLQALAYLHRREIIHCDLKPDNALVTADGTVRVLDFGLAAHRGDGGGDKVAGTLAYIAPEVLMGAAPGVGADLYAVGVIAYQLFVGRHPFDLKDVTSLLQSIVSKDPDLSPLIATEPLFDHADTVALDVQQADVYPDDVEIPPETDLSVQLALILKRLLNKKPEERFRSAEETIEALCAAARQPLPEETPAIRDSFLQAAQFVGRELELRTLETALTHTTDLRGGAWLIGGESGVGKSRLLEELRTRALIRGALVLRGQAAREGGRLYQVWVDVLRRLVLNTEPDDADAAVLKVLIPDIDQLLQRRISADGAEADPSTVQQRAEAMIASLFARQTQPTLVILEDLQWASAESLALLRHLVQITPPLPLLVVGSYRDDEAPQLSQTLPGMQVLRLPRLDADGIAALSASMLGTVGMQEPVVSLLQRETEGNIFFLIEVVRALMEEAGGREGIGTMTLPTSVFSGGILRIVQRRLERVSKTALPLLRAAAVAGRALDLSVLRAVLSAPGASGSLDDWLTECLNAAVLDVSDGQWRFAHDKLREGLLIAIPEEDLPALHRQIAQAVETVYGEDAAHVPVLVSHWRGAGDARKERHYAGLAAEQFIQISAYHGAITYAARALALTETLADEDTAQWKMRMLRLLGLAHQHLNEIVPARQYYEDSLTLARQRGEKPLVLRVLINLADVARDQGTFEHAEAHLQESLALADAIDDRAGRAHALGSYGAIRYLRGDHQQAREYLEKSLALSRQLNDSVRASHVLLILANLAAEEGAFGEAIEHYNAVIETFRAMGDRNAVGRSLVNCGECLRLNGDLDGAKERLAQGLRIFMEIGAVGFASVANLNLGEIALAQEHVLDAATHFCEGLRLSTSAGALPFALATIVGCAKLCMARQREARAVELLTFVVQHPAVYKQTLTAAQRQLDLLQSRLPQAEFRESQARAAGLELSALAAQLIAKDIADLTPS